MIVPDLVVAVALRPTIMLPGWDATSLMIFRWIHFLAGITWIGLLYFFNLVNVPFMKEMDAASKAKIVPSLMPRALWWFRWSAVITVLAGLAYFGKIVGVDAANGPVVPQVCAKRRVDPGHARGGTQVGPLRVGADAGEALGPQP